MLLAARYTVSTQTRLGVCTVRYAVPLSLALHGIFDQLDLPQTNGTLLFDADAGFCPTTAPGGICATRDRANDCLGPGSAILDSILYCTYPTASELASDRFFCDYTVRRGIVVSPCLPRLSSIFRRCFQIGGALITDANAGFCRPTAACGAPTLTVTSLQSATCTPG